MWLDVVKRQPAEAKAVMITVRDDDGRCFEDQNRAETAYAPRWARIVAVLGALIMLAGFGGLASARYLLGRLTDGIETTGSVLSPDSGAGTTAGANAGMLPAGAINLLMLGLDTRAGWDTTGQPSRSDSIIIVHVAASHDQAYMISIPRDAIVRIPADDTLGFLGATGKINGAYAYGSAQHGWQGGARLATEAVAALTGLTFDGVVVIDLAGFQRVINALGGVYLCVERDTWSSHYSYDASGRIIYDIGREGDYKIPNNYIHKKGCRTMAGWDALDYARQRYGLPNSDYDRQRHQQQLIRAMVQKATSAGVLANPAKVSGVIRAAGASLKMDTHGVPLTDFLFGLKQIAGADVIGLKTNGGTYATSTIGTGEGITVGTRLLFDAVKNDTLGPFVTQNPDYLTAGDGRSDR
jgi:LCP family protein required for cell wall assembly